MSQRPCAAVLYKWKGRERLVDGRPETVRRTQEFEELYRRYYAQVVRHLMYLVGERTVAEEVAQDVFFKLYTTPPPREENLLGWLYLVGSRLALNALRGEKRRRQREEQWVWRHYPEVVPLEEAAMRQAAVQRVRRVLESLRPRERLALLLRHVGFTYREIAEALGVAPGSVGTILVRAQKGFLARYRQEEGGTEDDLYCDRLLSVFKV